MVIICLLLTSCIGLLSALYFYIEKECSFLEGLFDE